MESSESERFWPPRLRIAFDEQQVRAVSRGEVKVGETLDYSALRPVPEGLFAPEIFGEPEVWPSDFWGHIELRVPVFHPEYHLGRPSLLAVILGVSQREVVREVSKDPEGLHARWSSFEVEAINAQTGERRRGSGPRSRWGRAAAAEVALGRKGPPVFRCVPVIPADFRRYKIDGTRISEHHANQLYRRVIMRNQRYERLSSMEAPVEVLRREYALLQEAVDTLFVNRLCRRPFVDNQDRVLHSLMDITGVEYPSI